MAREFVTSVDLRGNRLLNAVLTLENITSATAPFPVSGRLIYDGGVVKFHDGSAWIALATGSGGSGGVPSTLTLAAGAGLTGGGDLSANRTFDVGAGTGILVAADSIAVNTTVIQARSERGAANGYAPLDANSLIPTVHLPPLAINDTFVVTSQAAMLALTAQTGDMAIRTDTGKTYVLAAEPAAVLSNWKEIMAAGAVQSVNGQTGIVSITAGSLGAVDTGVQVIAGAGLVGGGALTGNVTVDVAGDGNLSIQANQINVLSAPKWTTPRSITLTGDATGSVTLDGSANVSLATTVTSGGLTLAAADAVFLKPSEILAGTNITVTPTGNSVTISSDHTHPFVNTSRWNYIDTTAMANPSVGNIRGDTAPGTPTTNLAIHSISATNIDKTDVLLALVAGDLIVVQEDLARENWVRFTVSGPVINNGPWFQIPVQQTAVGGVALARNDDVLISFTYGTGGGGGGGGGLTEAQADALFLKPTEILAGSNVSVSTAAGAVTISALAGSGTVILSGTASPTAGIGNVGEYYLDTDDNILYGPKAATTGGLGPTESCYNTIPADQVATGPASHGLGITVAVAGEISVLRYYRPASAIATSRTLHLWSNTGTELAVGVTSGESGTGWKTVTLDTPVKVTAGQQVRVSMDTALGTEYVAYDYIGGTPIGSNGANLTGTQAYGGASGAFPTVTVGTRWFVDIVFRPGTAPPPVWPVALESGDGGAAYTRATVSKTTPSLAAGAYQQTTVQMANGYRVYDLTCSAPARVRIYTDPTKQAADAARLSTVYPTGDHGLVLEFIAAPGLFTFDLSPALDGFDGKSTPDGMIPITITNTGSSPAAITCTLSWIRTE